MPMPSGPAASRCLAPGRSLPSLCVPEVPPIRPPPSAEEVPASPDPRDPWPTSPQRMRRAIFPLVTEGCRCRCLRDPLRREVIAQAAMRPPTSPERHRPAPAIGRIDARTAKSTGPVGYVPGAPAARVRQPVMEGHRCVDAPATRGSGTPPLVGDGSMPSRGVQARPIGRDQRRHMPRVPPFIARVLLGRRRIRRGSEALMDDETRVGQARGQGQGEERPNIALVDRCAGQQRM